MKSSSKFSFAGPSLESLDLAPERKESHFQLLSVYTQFLFCTLSKYAHFNIFYICTIFCDCGLIS